jgi:hypothetical protein
MIKFNWGTGIALVYATFAIGMVTMVLISTKHDPGLVQKDYYELDLNYQTPLNGKQNAAALEVKPAVLYDENQRMVVIQLPAGMTATNGNVKLYRSASVADDQLVEIAGQRLIQIPVKSKVGGRWHVELNWVTDQKNYYYETAILI